MGNALRFTLASCPDLDSLFGRQQQPTELGAIALVGGHVLAQGGEAAGAFVARAYTTGAGQPHYKIEAKHRVIRQAEACVEVSNAFQLPVARAQA